MNSRVRLRECKFKVRGIRLQGLWFSHEMRKHGVQGWGSGVLSRFSRIGSGCILHAKNVGGGHVELAEWRSTAFEIEV